LSFSILKSLKKSEEISYKNSYYPYLIVGSEFSSFKMLDFLRENCGDESVRLLTSHTVNSDDLCFAGMRPLRGKTNIELFQKIEPGVHFGEELCQSVFYKDQKFRNFGGRAKPASMLDSEEFFTSESMPVDMNQLTPKSFNDPGDTIHECIVSKIVHKNESNSGKWQLYTKNNEILECDCLLFADPLPKFLSLISKTDSLEKKLIDACGAAGRKRGFAIHFTAPWKITDRQETLFIPQSLTHDWGHFIGEFLEFDEEKGVQEFSFFSLIDDENSSPAELSKKIRNLKRSIQRVFGEIRGEFNKDSKASLIKEKIVFLSQVPGYFENDCDFDNLMWKTSDLFFIGAGSPIEKKYLEENNLDYNRAEISHLVRSMLSVSQITSKFNSEKKHFF